MKPTRIPNNLLRSSGLVQRPPKIITFDAYNTLYAIKRPVMEQYCIVGKKYGIDANPKELTLRFPEVFNKIRSLYPLYGKKSGITTDQWWENLIREVFKPLEIPQEMVRDILIRFEGYEAYTVYPDVKEFLEKMRTKYPDVILGIISNTDPIVLKLLENIGLKNYFDGNIYLSYDLEIKKPDPMIFQYAIADLFKRYDLQKEFGDLETFRKSGLIWHVGDEEKNDLLGAHNAGINGVLVDRCNEFGYFNPPTENPENNKGLSENELSLRKVCNESESSFEQSAAINDVIQVSEGQYVITNFKTLDTMLFY